MDLLIKSNFISLICLIPLITAEKGHTIIVKSDDHPRMHFEPFPVPVPVPVPIYHKKHLFLSKHLGLGKGLLKRAGTGSTSDLVESLDYPMPGFPSTFNPWTSASSINPSFYPYSSSFGSQSFPGFSGNFPVVFSPLKSYGGDGQEKSSSDSSSTLSSRSSSSSGGDETSPSSVQPSFVPGTNPNLQHHHMMYPSAGQLLPAVMSHPVFIPSSYPLPGTNTGQELQHQQNNAASNTQSMPQYNPWAGQYYSWPGHLPASGPWMNG